MDPTWTTFSGCHDRHPRMLTLLLSDLGPQTEGCRRARMGSQTSKVDLLRYGAHTTGWRLRVSKRTSGKILKDEDTVASYNIEEKGFVVCVVNKVCRLHCLSSSSPSATDTLVITAQRGQACPRCSGGFVVEPSRYSRAGLFVRSGSPCGPGSGRRRRSSSRPSSPLNSHASPIRRGCPRTA